ncbi:MAG: hypothetical protein U5K84_10265 [Alkalibacterium sp.]|nr:hypothetical protein [Alkalibacterium sp.]
MSSSSKTHPTDASVHNRLVGAIQRKHKQNARAIHFMEGYMNDDLTEGTMQYASSQQIRGEIRFTVDEDGKIIANPSDWDASTVGIKTENNRLTIHGRGPFGWRLFCGFRSEKI